MVNETQEFLRTPSKRFPALLRGWGLAVCCGILTAAAGGEIAAADEALEADALSVPEFIDAQIRQGWTDNEIQPGEAASDDEWIRRVYLDMLGRIPSVNEARRFIEDDNPRKRYQLIDELVSHEDFVRNMTTIWTNLSIGRGQPRRVSRRGMEKFFREAFAKNRPWDETVVDIITAEGHFEENGAVNYILAQMQNRDEGVQLTAKTARLFLGMQVQCTQCHNHPFNDWQQSQFWEFNSFFRQVAKRDHRKLDPDTGRMVDDYSEVVWQNFSGPVYFEKRSGLMQVAFPIYEGEKVDSGPYTDRREEFAKLLVQASPDQTPMIAQAFVNRMWGHFFGYGFTRPVDDMGPHNPSSHPELLARLSREFVDSDYDVRQLVRWIVGSEAYGLSSRKPESAEIDNPAAGEMPLFSYMYIKSMQAEQLYDSLLVASRANEAGAGGWNEREAQRRRWMQQFIVTFDNDENDEATTFNGTIPQALMMMNSELMDKAVSVERGSFLFETVNSATPLNRKIQDLYMAALTRMPSRAEQTQATRLIGQYPPNARLLAVQDLFWALLNSNEFILNH